MSEVSVGFVGAGYNPIAFGPAVTDEARRLVLRLLEPLGECPQVPRP